MATRYERVRLVLDDDFTTKSARATAATALLNREIKSLSSAAVGGNRDLTAMGNGADGAGRQIDRLSGRLALLGQALAVFGPAGAPLGGVAAAGLAGIAAQLGFAAVGAGVFMASMQGVGTALSAVNKAAIDPSAENIENANEALGQLSETSREFVFRMREIGPELKALRDAGAEELIPGLTESLDNLERFLPTLDGLVRSVAGGLGDTAADITESLASERWAPFMAFLEQEAPDAISELTTTTGSLLHGLSELWMAFQPLNDDFSTWLMDTAADFDDWSSRLSETEGFEEFIAYIRESGPQVASALGAVGGALVQVVQAIAPLGGPSLAIIETLADGLGAIADSDIGTPLFAAAAGLAAYNRSLVLTTSLQARMGGAGVLGLIGGNSGEASKARTALQGARGDVSALAATWATAGARTEREQARVSSSYKSLRGNVGAFAGEASRVAGPIAGLAAASGLFGDALDKNTVSLGLMGAAFGPWGAAAGAGVGVLMDVEARANTAGDALERFAAALDTGNLEQAGNEIDVLRARLEDLQGTDMAGSTFSSFSNLISGISVQDEIDALVRDIDESEAAYDRAGDAARRNADAQQAAALANTAAGGSVRRLTDDLGLASDGMLVNKAAIGEWRIEIAQSAQKFLGLGDSIDDAKVSLGEWLKQMENQAAALRNFRVNAEEAADKGLRRGLIDALREAGPEGALRMKQLANATEGEIRRANQAWSGGQREVKKYVKSVEDAAKPREGRFTLDAREGQATADETRRKLIDLGKLRPTPQVVVRADGVVSTLGTINSMLSLLDGKVAVSYVQTKRLPGDSPGFGPTGSADGSTVPDAPGPYRDQFLYALAQREEVISNRRGQADRFRPALKAINADMPRSIIRGMLADGGTAYGGPNDNRDGPARRPKFELSADAPVNVANLIKGLVSATNGQIDAALGQVGAAKASALAAEDQNTAAQKALDAAQTLYDGVASNTRGMFEIDPLARPSSPWAASDPFASLQGIIDRTTAFSAGSTALAGRGLDGAALAYGLESEDNLAQLSAMSDADLQRFEDLYNQATAGVESAALTAANVTYGAQLAEATSVALTSQALQEQSNGYLSAMQAQLETLTQRLEGYQQQAGQRSQDTAELVGAAASLGVTKGGNQVARRGRRDSKRNK